MNKIFARGGIEFIAVLLGLTLSLWIDENAKENDNNPKPNNSLGFGLGFNILTDISKYPIAGNEGSYGWHGSWGSYFKIDPKENLIMILMTQMKPWKYYNKEIFESLVYDAIKTPVNQ